MQPAPALMEVRIFIVCFLLTYVVLSTLDDNRRGKLVFHMRLELVKIALAPMSRSSKCAKRAHCFNVDIPHSGTRRPLERVEEAPRCIQCCFGKRHCHDRCIAHLCAARMGTMSSARRRTAASRERISPGICANSASCPSEQDRSFPLAARKCAKESSGGMSGAR